eukprot:3056630-Karenia_brevis.AAC.2
MMGTEGLSLHVINFNSAISDCEKGGQEGMSLHVINFNSAISTCQRGGQWQHLAQLLGEMHRGGGRLLHVITFSPAISTCENGWQWQQLAQLFRVAPCDHPQHSHISL